MTQSLAYPTSWDSHSATPAAYAVSFNDYLALDHHYPSAPSPPHHLHHSRPSSSSLPSPRQPRFENASWDASDLYQFSLDESPTSPLTSPEPECSPDLPLAAVKQEDTQDDFVFETPAVSDAATSAYPAFSSMTEVPLRATQASKEMRRMMGVFRLDPFTMHNAVRDPSPNLNWNGEPIGPLREDPVLLEFQLECPTDRIKSEQPAALPLVAEASGQPARKRRRVTPMYPDRSPTPEAPYTLDISPSSSPIEESDHGWSHSSADSHSLSYPPDLMRQQSTFFLTPAQGMEAALELGPYSPKYAAAPATSASSSLRMPSSVTSLSTITKLPHSSRSSLQHSSLPYASTDSPPLSYLAPSPPMPSSSPSYIHPSSSASSSSAYGSPMSSSYSMPSYAHHTEVRQSLAYTTSTPVRLPPPGSSRYVMHSQDLGVLGHDVDAAPGSIDDGTNGIWARKAVSLGMAYGSGKDAAGTQSSTGQTLSLAQPHAVASIASRRLASANVSIGGYDGITRSGRVAWA